MFVDAPTVIKTLSGRANDMADGKKADWLYRTGFYDLDNLMGGWRKGELSIIAARPSMGKTTFALNCILKLVAASIKTLFISVEMGPEMVYSILLNLFSGVSVSGAFSKGLPFNPNDLPAFNDACNTVSGLSDRLLVNDTTDVRDIEAVQMDINAAIKTRGTQIVFVDYLQLLHGDGDTREREIAKISGQLKAIARTFQIPVVVMCQLNRKVEDFTVPRPTLSCLRESGSIEQDADNVILMWRPCYYYELGLNIDAARATEFIISKQRMGETGEFYLDFNPSISAFANIDMAQQRAIRAILRQGEKK